MTGRVMKCLREQLPSVRPLGVAAVFDWVALVSCCANEAYNSHRGYTQTSVGSRRTLCFI